SFDVRNVERHFSMLEGDRRARRIPGPDPDERRRAEADLRAAGQRQRWPPPCICTLEGSAFPRRRAAKTDGSAPKRAEQESERPQGCEGGETPGATPSAESSRDVGPLPLDLRGARLVDDVRAEADRSARFARKRRIAAHVPVLSMRVGALLGGS